MRRLLDKVLKLSTTENRISAPSLSPDLTFSELTFRTKRGFLAKKMSTYLGISDEEGDFLYYFSLAKPSFMNQKVNNSHELLIQLSEQMLVWDEQKQDLPQFIQQLDVGDHITRAMLLAYENNKYELFSATAKKRNQMNVYVTEPKRDQIWKVYRDVIYSATQEKFLLIENDEIQQFQAGKILCQAEINTRADIPVIRNRAKEKLEKKVCNSATIMSWLLVLSEATTNTIKHANKGKVTIIEDIGKEEIRFIIEDQGPGFPLEKLPKATLMAGYSTKNSMGQGFTLMMKMTKHIYLYTSEQGSTLILTFDDREGTDYKGVS